MLVVQEFLGEQVAAMSKKITFNVKIVQVKLPKYELLNDMIWKYFGADDCLKKMTKFVQCNICGMAVGSDVEGNLPDHLKIHKNTWNKFLVNLSSTFQEIVEPSLQNNELKCAVELDGMKLCLPICRVSRRDSLSNPISLDGFEGRLQMEYNKNPMGPYMGPYDQAEVLPLSVQLPQSDMTYSQYVQFCHDGDSDCKSFKISNNYEDIKDTEKIDALEVKSDELPYQIEDVDHNHTCNQNKGCDIPCICKDCCLGDSQCQEHKIRHPEAFDHEKDSLTIRSSELQFKTLIFLDVSYIIKYAGIPTSCIKCRRDLLHHNLYHFVFHVLCKFCRQIGNKLRAITVEELKNEIKAEEQYLKTVCPICDAKFADPWFRKRHMKYEHGGDRFECGTCDHSNASKMGLDYHVKTKHMKTDAILCKECQIPFQSDISLKNHIKYVHNVSKTYICEYCDDKFNQKKNLTRHLKHIHSEDFSKATYMNLAEKKERFQCDDCEANYKYKGDLSFHVRTVHDEVKESAEDTGFQCEICKKSYKIRKCLMVHMKNKHTEDNESITCKVCGKTFTNRSNFLRHEGTQHKAS